MSGFARTVFLPENWDQSTHEADNGMNESIDESLQASAEEEPSTSDDAVSLPPETLVEIAALNDEEALCQMMVYKTVQSELWQWFKAKNILAQRLR